MDLRLLRIVIASPGDVKAEREIIPHVIDEVNRNIARERGLHLDVYRWETDSHPGFHPLGPQGLIDPKLKIEDCDLLIGIFWRRFGTPVSDAKSGTEHEFRIAYEAWKKNGKPQIFVYFSQKAYAPKSKEETDQWGLVLQFKKEFPREGLWWDYKNKVEFERLLRNHLTQFLGEQSPTEKQTEVVPPIHASLTSLFQLPPPPADFTGRDSELQELRAAIEKGGVHISGLQGQGGVGKTALALKLAAELAPRFPDAQIYLDLKGVSEKPLAATEALAHVVRSFHPEAKLPEEESGLRALFNTVLHDKRALLLMDNARDAAQVEPLLPPQGCMLLVTSRPRFTLTGLHPKHLDTLAPTKAEELLLRIAPGIDGEAEAIAKLCGYLPQALRLAAKAIADRVDLDPADYRHRLSDEKRRLELLGSGDKGVDASLRLSYNLIDGEMQKRWRMTGVFPDTFEVAAATAVWEMKSDAAQDVLSHLLQFSMLEWDATTKRYRLHDLMRAFARGKLTEPEFYAAGWQHARHYFGVIRDADNLYAKGGEAIMRGLALFDLEWGNIQAGQAWAVSHAEKDDESAQLCSGYPDHGAYILNLRQHPRECIRWRESALAAARRMKDRAAESRHLGILGLAYDSLGNYRRAIEYHTQQLTIDRELGDRGGEGVALGNLGLAYDSLGEYRRAIEYHEQHLTIARQIGNQRSEGDALNNLGVAYRSLGEYRRAIDYHNQHLTIAREMGERRGEGIALRNLGTAYYLLGEYSRAIGHYEQDLAIAREIGDRHGEGEALSGLGIAYKQLGELRRAIEHHEQQLAIAREIDDLRAEGSAHWNMCIALDKLGERKQAIEHAEAALKIFEQIETPDAAKVRGWLKRWKSGQ